MTEKKNTFPRFTEEERQDLLRRYHPDYREEAFSSLVMGENQGDRVLAELAALLQGRSHLFAKRALPPPLFAVDVLVIGGGGAGAAAAIEADQSGASVLLATKLRFGDSNTVMAKGGMQAVSGEDDSPAKHYLDAFGGGHFAADPSLLKTLVTEGPSALLWLERLGVAFDRTEEERPLTTHGGGTSRRRMHAVADRTGAEIMRVLRDEVCGRRIPVLEYAAAVELLLGADGQAVGAVFWRTDRKEWAVVCAKSVVLATGGGGQLCYGGFSTTNHRGATADGLVLAYRAGAALAHPETMQYHPTGAVFPPQLAGELVTEKVRALGASLLGADKMPFVHPLEPRDVVAAAIIRECTDRQNGVTKGGKSGVWLDTPSIDRIHGDGTVDRRLPDLKKTFLTYGVDIRKEPILVYPTLHYQNGGVAIDADAQTTVCGLYAAGEVTGGIHGKNRLMGNSLLDIIVFGRIAGKNAARYANTHDRCDGTLSHLAAWEEARARHGLTDNIPSPILFPHAKGECV